jgi:hypothetical protein
MQTQGGAAGAFELTIPSRFNRANIDAGIGRRAYRGIPYLVHHGTTPTDVPTAHKGTEITSCRIIT